MAFQSRLLRVKHFGDAAVILLDRERSATNFVDLAMLDDLDKALDDIAKNAKARLLVIRSTKDSFCHGTGPNAVAGWKAEDFAKWAEHGQQVCTKLNQLALPSVCFIAGNCHDAGLELALACDHRVAVNSTMTTFAFPQLEWGLIPCWGTTQRLPRLIGLENCLQMLLGSQKFSAREAWFNNLVDEMVEEGNDEPPACFIAPRKRDWNDLPARNWRETYLESNSIGRWFLFRGADRIVRTRVPEGLPAPAELVQAMRLAYESDSVEPGMFFERQAVARIAADPALRHLLRLLQQRERLRTASLSDGARSRQVGVIGAGVAGLALLIHTLTKGYGVVLKAGDEQELGGALSQIVHLLQREVQNGAMTEGQYHKLLSLVRGTFTWTNFDKVDLIFDTTQGQLADKQAFHKDVEQHVPKEALLVPVSSYHRVEEHRQGVARPQQVFGIHIVEPWTRTSLAEIVTGPGMSPMHLQRIRDWAITVGKPCLQVPDVVGGLVMRVWLPALNEAGLLIKEGVPIERIDHAMRRFGMSHGPLEWMERLGIDHIASLLSVMGPVFGERIKIETGFHLMAERRWYGKKTALGFYVPGWGEKLNPHADAVVLWQTQSQGEAPRQVPVLAEADALVWVQERLVTLTILEALRCLDEGVARDPDELDCALCLSGWASHRGGPIGYARDLGIEALTARCSRLAEYGPRYAMPTRMPGLV
jgi:3-hydroxyacyl-CoA dehydrogenase/enoyl-CoA hydratase/3-hydroxybutyryl-CoA epimerase